MTTATAPSSPARRSHCDHGANERDRPLLASVLRQLRSGQGVPWRAWGGVRVAERGGRRRRSAALDRGGPADDSDPGRPRKREARAPRLADRRGAWVARAAERVAEPRGARSPHRYRSVDRGAPGLELGGAARALAGARPHAAQPDRERLPPFRVAPAGVVERRVPLAPGGRRRSRETTREPGGPARLAVLAAEGWQSFLEEGQLARSDRIVESPRGAVRFSALVSFQRWHAAYHYRQLVHVLGAAPELDLTAFALPRDVF